jgi:hypothetical protein
VLVRPKSEIIRKDERRSAPRQRQDGNHAFGGDVTAGYVQMGPERLREAAQQVCEKLLALCSISAPSGRNVSQIR